MDYKIRVTPEESELVQTHCFSMGIQWAMGQEEVILLDSKYLFLTNEKFPIRGYRITHSTNEVLFKCDTRTEITANQFIHMTLDDIKNGNIWEDKTVSVSEFDDSIFEIDVDDDVIDDIKEIFELYDLPYEEEAEVITNDDHDHPTDYKSRWDTVGK